MPRILAQGELPKVPSFRLSQVFEVCQQLMLTVGVRVYHDTLVGEEYADFVESVRTQLPRVSSYSAVDESCREVLNTPLTPERFKELVWRLAGNLGALQAGRPVPRWTSQRVKEWVPVQISRVWPAKNQWKKAGHLCNLRVLAGTACPLVLQKFWSREACGVMSSRLGFSRRYGKRPYQSAMLLSGLRMCVLLEPELCRDGPMFQHVEVPGVCLRHNRELLKARLQRIPPCPQAYTHPCYRCAVGADACPFATHRDTFIVQPCPACGQAEALFDPEMSLNACRKCFLRELLRE